MYELKECLRASVEMLLDKLNDRLHEDMDYISTLARRHSLSSSTGSTAAIFSISKTSGGVGQVRRESLSGIVTRDAKLCLL